MVFSSTSSHSPPGNIMDWRQESLPCNDMVSSSCQSAATMKTSRGSKQTSKPRCRCSSEWFITNKDVPLIPSVKKLQGFYIHVRKHNWRPNTYLLLCHISHQYSALQRIECKRPSTESISNEHSASGYQNLMNRDSIFSLWGQVMTWGPEELGMTFIPC